MVNSGALPPFKLYIFDFDGTLVNTMELWNKMTRRFLAVHDITISDETLAFLNTQNFEQVLVYFIDELKINMSVEQLKAEWYNFAVEVFKREAVALKGAPEALARLKARGAPLALFTLSPRPLIEMLLQKLDLGKYFDRTFMAGETMRPKTEADSFLEIASLMGIPPKDTLVIEDSPYASTAAKAAGMTTCGIAINNEHESALREICDYMLSDYEIIV